MKYIGLAVRGRIFLRPWKVVNNTIILIGYISKYKFQEVSSS